MPEYNQKGTQLESATGELSRAKWWEPFISSCIGFATSRR